MKTFQEIYQESYEEIQPDKCLRENIMEEAGRERSKWMYYAILRPVAAVLAVLLILFGGTSVLASNVGVIYGIIEKASPALADLFVPVQKSCIKAGICMEVEAIYLEEGDKNAHIYVSFRDTQSNRIQGPADLFDSYSLSSMNSLQATWATGGIYYVGYDEESGKAYYKVDISSDAVFDRSKLTFRVRELLLTMEEKRQDISLKDIVSEMPTKLVNLSGRGGMKWEMYAEEFSLTMEEPTSFEKVYASVDSGNGEEEIPVDPLPQSSVELLDGIPVSACAVDDFTITGLAYWDNVLRLQICMGDLSHADRHVQPFLVLADGSERHEWFSYCWQERQDDKRMMFYEYYLPCTPKELETASLYGIFHTAHNSLEGNWKVTFRVEEKEE